MQPGDVVAGRFTIEKLAGAGGMGAIFRASDRRDGARVALKILRSQGASDRDRFDREARVLADLRHPGIVRYVAQGLTPGGQPYLAMEWLEGEDLAERLSLSRLSLEETLTLGHSVAAALAEAHAKGVVHRDIKPNNLFLEGGDIARVKVLDFGIASVESAALRSARSGKVVGTPAYMAPEQARGEGDLDARADVFALGCVLFECLTGRKPFDGSRPLAVLGKILLEDPPRLCALLSHVPAPVDDLVARMLSKDRSARPGGGAQLAAELSAIARSVPSAPSAVSAPPIAPDEPSLVSVILVGAPGRQDPMDFPFRDEVAAPPSALREIAARSSARLEVLGDGAAVALLTTEGSAARSAALAARCALALRAATPAASIVVAAGRSVSLERPSVGEVIDRAALLLDRAPRERRSTAAGSAAPIRIDETLAGLLDAGFDVKEVPGAVELRGERESAFVTARTLLGKPTPCIGREREIASILATLDECVSTPMARVVLVTGPSGIGKSRVLHEILREVARRPAPVEVWAAQGDAISVAAPLGIAAGLLRSAAGVRGGEPLAARRAKLLARVGRHVPITLIRPVAEFTGEIMGAPFPDDASAALHAARQDSLLMGDRMRQAFEDLVAAECAARPLLIVLEDLHWGDLPSVQFIDGALRQLRDRPLMVVALSRPDVHDLFPKLWAGRRVQEVRVGELSRRAGERLARHALGDEVPGEQVEAILDRAEGNAFALEELIRAAAEGRALDAPQPAVAIVRARLAALPPVARRVLRAASVFGQVFWGGGVAHVLSGAPAAASAPEWLSELARQEVILARHEGRFPGEHEFAFPHAIVRDAVYATLTEEEQRTHHRLAAAWLTKLGETEAAVLAEHHERGGEPERAVSLYLHAAEQALAGSDLRAALGRARRGVACGAEGEAKGALLLVQAEANTSTGRNIEADVCATEASRLLARGTPRWFSAIAEVGLLSGKLGNYDRLVPISQELFRIEVRGAPDAYAICAARIAVHLFIAGHGEVADHLLAAAEAASTAAPVPDPMMLAFVARARGMRAMLAGDLSAFLLAMKDSAEGFERAGAMRSAIGQRANVAHASLQLGSYAAAEAALRDVLATAERMGLHELSVGVRHHLAMALGRQGSLPEALSVITAALAAAIAHRSRRLEGLCRTYRSTILLLGGDAAGAAEEARAAVDIPTLAPPMRAYPLGALARAQLARGLVDEALSAAEKAMALMQSPAGIEEGEFVVHLAHVEALLASGRSAAAAKAIGKARDQLLAKAGKIGDPAAREGFLGHVPENAEILSLARRWLKDEPPRRSP